MTPAYNGFVGASGRGSAVEHSSVRAIAHILKLLRVTTKIVPENGDISQDITSCRC